MSRQLAKIMLALLMLPLAVVVGIVSGLLGFEVLKYRSDTAAFGFIMVVTGVFVATYWILLWRSTVKWTRERLANTIVAAFIAVITGVFVGALGMTADISVAVFLGSVVAILLWLAMTVFAWRETADERVARLRRRGGHVIVCPRCGYNMTGLGNAACPECGTAWTVDELLAGQPAREAEEV